MPACCLNLTTRTSTTKGVTEFCSSDVGHAPLLSGSCKSSFTECRIVARFLRSVDSLLTWDISSASHFPLEVEGHCKQRLGPSQRHQWTKRGLLIFSESHNGNAQRDLDKKSGPGYCLSCRVLSCTVQKPAPLLPTLVSWIKCFWGYLWKEWSWGRQEAVGFMALWSYYWSWPSLWLPLDKEYANTWGSNFTTHIYLYHLFV